MHGSAVALAVSFCYLKVARVELDVRSDKFGNKIRVSTDGGTDEQDRFTVCINVCPVGRRNLLCSGKERTVVSGH